MHMPYEFIQKVLFKHCDPAGIVFYPRYFEMMNDCVEHFFDEVLAAPFETLHITGGVPTAQIETRFTAPSRHGDVLTLRLALSKIGRSSVSYTMNASCRDEARFETKATLVNIGPDGRSTLWPDPIRATLTEFKDKFQ